VPCPGIDRFDFLSGADRGKMDRTVADLLAREILTRA